MRIFQRMRRSTPMRMMPAMRNNNTNHKFTGSGHTVGGLKMGGGRLRMLEEEFEKGRSLRIGRVRGRGRV